MTPDERDLLQRALSDLQSARPEAKDAEAARMIDAAVRSNPDASYVLVQHAILSDQALRDAQARIADLEQALDAREDRRGEGGFLGGVFGGGGAGRGPDPRWNATAVPPAGAPFDPRYDERAHGGGGGPFSGGGGLGGFLRQAGVAAAGVAGGAFLFQGLSNMFDGDREHHGLFGGGEDHERQGLFGAGDQDVASGGAHDLFGDGGTDGGGDDWG